MRTYEPIPKPKRIVDAKAIESARLPWCEVCGRRTYHPKSGASAWQCSQVAHKKSRGSGGHDEASNLYSTCLWCHGDSHQGLIELIRNYPKDSPPPGFIDD